MAWALCQVLHCGWSCSRAVAELLACQSARWDSLARCPKRQRERRIVLQESFGLLRKAW
ncbi:unnamed protein product [Durusdinium trenchii]|uniref:Uncharacterized protein n=1 Tax=Durusdinium trenchii TaxID=1381693 RepID=A0ABP0NJM4_9DINO